MSSRSRLPPGLTGVGESVGRADSTGTSCQARFYQVTFRPTDEHRGTPRERVDDHFKAHRPVH